MIGNRLFNDTGFNIGFWLGVLLCVAANYLSYFNASVEHQEFVKFMRTRMLWGFPFDWFGVEFMELHIIANVFAFVFVCFGLGLLFRFIWSGLGYK